MCHMNITNHFSYTYYYYIPETQKIRKSCKQNCKNVKQIYLTQLTNHERRREGTEHIQYDRTRLNDEDAITNVRKQIPHGGMENKHKSSARPIKR